MLTRIFIYNFVVFDEAEVELNKGFNAISGESGSGKSMIFAAINFALGVNKYKNPAKDPNKDSIVIIEFSLNNHLKAEEFLREHSLYFDEHVIIKRALSQGRTKYYINDIPSTANLVEKFTSILVQSATGGSNLINSSQEILILLDSYIKNDLTNKMQEKYAHYIQIRQKLEQVKDNIAMAERDKEYLEYAVKEIQKTSPKKGEEEELSAKKKTIQNSKQINELLDKCQKALISGVIDNLWLCQKNLAKLAEITEAEDFFTLEKEIESSAIIAEESLGAIKSKISLNWDIQDIEEVENRLYNLKSLARKYNCSIDYLPELLEDFTSKLNDINMSDDGIHQLELEFNKIKNDYILLAQEISKERKKIAKNFANLVNKELQDLNMQDSSIYFNFQEKEEIKPHGLDEVSISINHLGSNAGKLSSIASGGERSRITLAFNIARFADKANNDLPVLLFDEVDTGIGGFVARKVGEKLKKLGQSQQIIAITHNPQVASLAQEHFNVHKIKDSNIFKSKISKLSLEMRKEEIARMISGLEITEEAFKQAEKLLTD